MNAPAAGAATNGVAVDAPRDVAVAPPAVTPQTRAPEPVDRLGAIWRGRGWILLAGVVAALLTFGTTTIVPKTFSSGIQVSLNASPVTGSSVSDLAKASNDLAAQYAQLVTSEAVLAPAARSTGTTTVDLSSRTASSTVAGQNIVLITVQASRPEQAQARAKALGASLVSFITTAGQQASKDYSASVIAQLAPLDAQIVKARRTVDRISASLAKTDEDTAPQSVSAAAARLGSAQALLSSLSDRRSSLATQATLQSISLAPRAQVLGEASVGAQIEPRPALYTLVGAVLGLVIGAQVVLVVADRRQRRRGQGTT